MPAAAENQLLSVSEIAAARKQLDRLLADPLLRTSKRSAAFLRYIVEETLTGNARDLKERTIGVSVFGKALTYDTNLDHVVRTAASELRKRLALYYGQEEHREEMHIVLVPGSYVPQFQQPNRAALPAADVEGAFAALPVEAGPPVEADQSKEGRTLAAPGDSQRKAGTAWWSRPLLPWAICLTFLAGGGIAWHRAHPEPTLQQQFWKPLLDSGSPVLIAIGDVPGGPPIATADDAGTPSPAKTGPPAVPYADVVTIARISAILSSFGRDYFIRQENSRSFADLRERPVVLIGAFNNEWSLQLTRNMRYTLAVDPAHHLLYIRDREHPDSRAWGWDTRPHPDERDRASSTTLHDYALITRILDSDTGHDVIVMGGLYAYGTQAAGEFVASHEMASLPRSVLSDVKHKKLQIVLETTVTDATPGPPHVVAVSLE